MNSGQARFLPGIFLLLAFLAGCAGAPVTHPNQVKARESLSEAQELLMQNHPGQALASVRKALDMHRLSGDFPGTIDDMNRMARLSFYLGRVDTARQWIDRALLLEGVSDFPGKKAETLLLAAQTAPAGKSGPWIAEAHRITDAMPRGSKKRDQLEARLFQVEGVKASDRKDYQGAIPLFRQALLLDSRRKDFFSLATDHASLARNYYLSGDYKKALVHFDKAFALDKKLRNHAGIAFDLEGTSLVEAELGKYLEAAKKMMEASGVEMGLGRMGLARRDVGFARSIFKEIRTPDAERFRTVLQHWFDTD